MLTSLTIKNFIVADDVQINFNEGMTSFVGETGAGKSVIIDALAICCGSKTNPSKIRNDDKKAYIEAVFEMDDSFLKNHDSIEDYLDGDKSLIISTSFTAKGTVTRKINGRTVTLAMLKELTKDLIDIHSQGDNRSLFTSKGQLEMLDNYGGKEIESALKDYTDAFEALMAEKKKYDDFILESKKEDPDFLRYRINEIEKHHLKPDEIENCEKRINELSEVSKIEDGLKELEMVIEPFEEVESSLQDALRKFNGTSFEEKSIEILDCIRKAKEGAEEIASTSVLDDPNEIDRLNERLFELGELRHKYGKSTSSILEKLDEMKQKLQALDDFEIEKKQYETKIGKLKSDAYAKADKLSSARVKFAKILSDQVSKEMEDLALAKNGFLVDLSKQSDLCEYGLDEVSFMIRLNQGFDFSPLKTAASGGEGSRIMLSLKMVLNKNEPVDVAVFDEIDSGISGRIAYKAGLKLYSVSKSYQVVVITHLPQVCCFSDNVFMVTKKEINGETVTGVNYLDLEGTCLAISNMIRGDKNNDDSIKAAKTLINEANDDKNKLNNAKC